MPGPAIVLVEDEPITRTSLRRLLEGAGFEVRAEAGNAETAIEATVRERPRLCLVDFYIPGDGIRVVREVSRRVPEAAVVVLTASRDRDDLIDAIRAAPPATWSRAWTRTGSRTRSAACSRARRRSRASW